MSKGDRKNEVAGMVVERNERTVEIKRGEARRDGEMSSSDWRLTGTPQLRCKPLIRVLWIFDAKSVRASSQPPL